MSNNLFLSSVSGGGGGGGGVINTTYTDLVNLITSNTLIAGTIYEFSYLLKFNMIGTAGEFTADNSEIIQVIALTNQSLRGEGYSVSWNENIIYDINPLTSFDVSTINSTGYISCRYLNSLNTVDAGKINYKVNFDFRNQYFYKYVTATNLVGFTNVDNGTAFIKYLSIDIFSGIINSKIGFCQNVEFTNLANIENSTFKINAETIYNYKKIELFNSKVILKDDGFADLKLIYTDLNNVLVDNVKLTAQSTIIENSKIINTSINNFDYGIVKNKSEINNSSFNNLQFINLDNSILETCTSIGNFTVNCVNSSIILAKDCYVLTYFDLNGQGMVFNNNDIINGTSRIRYLKFSSGGTEFTYTVPVGFAIGVYDMFYLPQYFWTVDKQFVAIPDVPNPFLGAVFNIGNNGAFNNLLFNLSELTVIAGNVNNNVTVPIRINVGGMLKFQILIANCNNAMNFTYILRTIS